MKLHKLLVFTLVVLLGTALAGPKPANTYCDTAEVIIPGVTHEQVVNSLADRYRQRGDTVLVSVPDTLQSCNARCSTMSPAKAELRSNCQLLCNAMHGPDLQVEHRPGPIDIVFAERPLPAEAVAAFHAHSPLDPSLEISRLQMMVSDARSGVRVQASATMVAFPGKDEEVVMDYSIPLKEQLKLGLEKLADSIGGVKRTIPPVSDGERAAAVKAGIERLESSYMEKPQLTYAFEDSIDPQSKSAVGSIRKVVDKGYALRRGGALDKNVALVSEILVQPDTAALTALIGPTQPKNGCNFPVTLRFQSTRTGWYLCAQEQMAC